MQFTRLHSDLNRLSIFLAQHTHTYSHWFFASFFLDSFRSHFSLLLALRCEHCEQPSIKVARMQFIFNFALIVSIHRISAQREKTNRWHTHKNGFIGIMTIYGALPMIYKWMNRAKFDWKMILLLSDTTIARALCTEQLVWVIFIFILSLSLW